MITHRQHRLPPDPVGISVLLIIAVMGLASLFLFGCKSPQKQLRRLLADHPELASRDTIHDTIAVPVAGIASVDTFITERIDTVYLDTGRLHVRVIRHLDTLIVQGECAPDTIVHHRRIIVDKLVPCPPKKRPTMWAWMLLAFFLGAYLFAKR